MNRIKRCVTLILSLAIVMTGIYLWANPTKEVQAETTTEANPDMLSLKFQRGITEATSNKIRVVASVDSPNYRAVGFEIAKDGGEATKFTIDTKQYPLPQRIKSSVEGMEYSFSPKVVDTSSEYFLTGKWTAVAGTKYTVRAWVKTFDGDMIYGQSRCITLEDLSTTEYLNMSFELKEGCTLSMSAEDETKYADINVTYNGTTTTAEVIDVKEHENGKTVYVNVKDVNRTELPSATKFVFKDSQSTECGSTIFRNLYTSYSETTEGETTTNTADTSWYTVYNQEDSTEDEFIIATNADMYGFAQLVNGGNQFADTKVYLVSDIALNKGLATESSWDTTQDVSGQAITDGTSYEWTSIGYNDTNNFKGNFDAQGHEVTGLLDKVLEGGYQGLFGWANTSSSIKKLYLTNSYIEANNASGTGSITGRASGAIDTVYSNAVILCSNAPVGGIAGKYQAENKTDTQQFTNLKYDGTIQITSSTSASPYVGGILGMARRGTLTIDDCLFSGNIKVSQSNDTMYVGGVLGGIYRVSKSNDYVVVTIQNNLNSGVLEISEGVEVGHSVALFGYLLTGSSDTGISTFNISDSYYTNKGAWGDVWYEGTTSSQTGQTSTEVLEVNKSEITGLASYYNKILVNTDTTDAWVPTTGTVELKAFAEAPMSVTEPENINLDWYTGIADNYTICSEDDTSAVKNAKLRGFAYLVNGGVSFEGKTVYLGADVTLNQDAPATKAEWDTYIEANTLEEWTPIGENDYGFEFSGTFDGGNNSIKGIYVDSDNEGIGFFRSTSDESTIQNLKIENSYFKTSLYYVGSVVASCGGNIDNLYSNAVVVSSNSYSGGLIGQIWNTGLGTAKTISKCWYAGEMSVANNAGGLIGVIAQGKIDVVNCLYTGNLQYNSSGSNKRIGGLCGRLALTEGEWTGEQATETRTIDLEMINCLSMGDIQDGTKSRIGSIIGEKSAGKAPTFTNVYATKESYCYKETDYPLVGYGVSDTTGITQYLEADLTVSDSTSTEDVQSKLVGFDFANTWTIGIDGKPVLASFAETIDVAWYDGDGIIDTRAELVGLSYLSQTQSIDKNITLAADIDLNPGWTASETSGRPDIVWSPVGNEQYPFTGTFDGNGHTISGIYLDGNNQYVGFFGRTGEGCEITDFRIENSYFNNATSHYIGSVVGQLCGNMSKVYSNAIVKSEKSRIGGLVAFVDAPDKTDELTNPETISITDCWFDGKVIGKETGQNLGGIVSTLDGANCKMENILFTGQIKSGYTGESNVYIGGIVAEIKQNMTLDLESVISAGTIMCYQNYKNVHAIVGKMSYSQDTETNDVTASSALNMRNVFATRDCCETVYGSTKNVSITGTVVRTTGADRLIGTGYYEEKNSDSTACVLDFSEWSMRKDNVPIPMCFSNMSQIKSVVVQEFTAETLAEEIGLDYWDASAQITDMVSYGAGNYRVTYNATSEKLDKYIAKLETLGFDNWIFNNGTGMADDGVLASTCYKAATKESGEWVVNITYVKKVGKIYISANSDVKSVAPTLQKDNYLSQPSETGNEAISLSMLEILSSSSGDNGNSFVFRLPNKHFIVIDGGREQDGKNLVGYLRGLVDSGHEVVIDAWFITHYHADHSGALEWFYSDISSRTNFYLEAIYACEPSSYALNYYETEQQRDDVDEALRGVRTLTKKSDGKKPDVYQLHMGQRYYFYGMTMDVIDTQEQRHVTKWGSNAPDDFNASSTNCVFAFKDKNNDVKKVLIGGDATNTNLQHIMQAYGEKNQTLSDIDVFVAYHHGLNTSINYYVLGSTATMNWSNFLLNNNGEQFEVVFFPYYKIYQNDDEDLPSSVYPDNIGDINQYLCQNATAYYTYGYGDSTGATETNRHGTVKITFDGNNKVTLYASNKFTTPME